MPHNVSGCDKDDDDISIEVICRKLYKYGLIDLDRDNRLWIEREELPSMGLERCLFIL